MDKDELKQKYDQLVAGIESARMFDGRNKGVDIYVRNAEHSSAPDTKTKALRRSLSNAEE